MSDPTVNETGLNAGEVAGAGFVDGSSSAAVVVGDGGSRSGDDPTETPIDRYTIPTTTGTEFTLTLPNDGHYRMLIGGYVLFFASGTVVNRYPGLQLGDPLGAATYTGIWVSTPILASQAAAISPTSGDNPGVVGFQNVTNQIALTLPKLWLPPGSQVGSFTPGLQAGDQWAFAGLGALVFARR